MEIKILVKIPFSFIVIKSPGTMLGGTLTRNRLILEGMGVTSVDMGNLFPLLALSKDVQGAISAN